MKMLLCASTAALALLLASSASTTPAAATDLGVAPIYRAPSLPDAIWTRSYIGVAGGNAWGSAVVSNDATAFNQGPRIDLNGGMTNFTAGMSVQRGNLVLGYEGDASITGRNDAAFGLSLNSAFGNEVRERWLSTFRGRVGFAQDNWLIYATAGGAFGSLERNLIGAPAQISERHWHWGVAAGGGVEVKITHDWSAKVEYLYVGLQDKPFFNPAPTSGFATNQRVNPDDHILRFGVNYKLPWTVLDSFFTR